MSAFRQALLLLVRRPAFTLACVATLAAGIGTTVGLFSVVDALFMRSLPYPDADRLVGAFEVNRAHESTRGNVAPAKLDDWKRLSQAFDAVSGSYAETVTDLSGDEPERLDGRRVMPEYFTVFGAMPLVGRTLSAAEETFGGPGAAVISERLWARRYARLPAVLDRALVIGDRTFAIVGVMPAAFATNVDVWLPVQMPPALAASRDAKFIGVVGRLKPGFSLLQAQGDLERVQQDLARAFPRSEENWSVALEALQEVRVGTYRRPLLLVFAAVCLLLVIGLANVAGLMLAQLRRRHREFAVRAALGASRAQLVAVVVWETSILVTAGAAAGTAIARAFVAAVRSGFTELPRIDEVQLDARALLAVVVLAAIATCACGLIPALGLSTRTRPLSLLDRRGTSGRHRVHAGLVAAQVALGLLLLTTAGILLRSYANLTQVPLGFDAAQVVTFRVGSGWNEDRARVAATQAQIVARLQERDDVVAAGLTNFLPTTSGTFRFQARVDGVRGPEADGMVTVGYRIVSAGYLPALGVPLLAGAWCPELRAEAGDERTVLMNRAFLERMAAGSDLIGRQLHITQAGDQPLRIVGMVGDLLEDGQGAGVVPYLYACEPAGTWPDPVFVARTRTPEALMQDVRSIVRDVDGRRAIFAVQPLADVVRGALARPRLQAWMLTAFATMAIGLTALGLFGLFVLLVAERTREVGIRMALGAAPRDIGRLVLGQAAMLVGGGAVVGLVLSAASHRALSGALFGVPPIDVSVIALALVTLVLVAVGATAVPVGRATRTDPVQAMRVD